MKKLLLFIVFAFAFGVNVMAQNFFGGVILGGTTSQIGGDARGGYNKVGVVGGVFAGLNLAEDFDVQMELKYIQKGSYSADFENYPAYDPFLIKLDYADLPIVFSYNLNKINVNDINLSWLRFELGLSFDFLINYRQEILGVTVPASNPWNKVVLNTIVGFRVNVKDNLEIGLRAVDSMTSICQSFKEPYSNGNVVYTRRLFGRYGMFNDVLQLALFWKI
ncbi:MAG: outer membrane beta-barrel protein [Bacteroidales bacterium]|nr:outer membrane beta-barrel protein [Bacteroidales bacterium]